jgi:hypothetical protein
MQRPHLGNDIPPRGDFNLDAPACQHPRHIGDGLLQRQIFARDIGTRFGIWLQGQQRLRVGIEIFYLFDHEFRAGLHDFLHGATLNRAQDTLAVLLRDIRRQLDLDLENLRVTVFRVDDIILRQADIFGRNIPGIAVQLHEVSRTQGRRRQKIIERARRRAITLIADRLVGDHREVIELGFEPELVEEVDFDFHGNSR